MHGGWLFRLLARLRDLVVELVESPLCEYDAVAASPQLHVVAEYFVFDLRTNLEQSGQELFDFLVFLEFEAILLNDLEHER